MQVITSKTYKQELAAQPWHSKLEEVRSYFQTHAHSDITTESGFNTIMSSESLRDKYNDMVASLCGDDESTRETIKSITRHSCEDVRNPIAAMSHQTSSEATDAMANNANYNALARMNSWLIVGYAARSKCLELYHTISSDDPTVSFKYNIDYIMRGNDPTKYLRPQADRNGDLGELYELPQLLPTLSADRTWITEKASAAQTNGTDIWLHVAGGLRGNLFTDSGKYDATKYTLEKNPRITGIAYTITGTGDDAPSTATASGVMSVYFDRKTSTGESQKKPFMNTFTIAYENAAGVAKSVNASIMGELDLDSGDYVFSVVGPVTDIQLDVRLTNVANEMGTIRSGNYSITEDFAVDNHPYGSIPIVPEMSDDFNAGGEGVSAVAYFTDKVTSALANARDVTMEKDLDVAYTKGPENATLYPKLGGFKGNVQFPLTARLAGGGDPFSWMKTGLKDTIIFHLSNAEMSCYFEDNIPRMWYILGSEQDVQRIPDTTFSNWDGEGGVGEGETKYGFQLDGKAGFMDNMGRRVRVIGSHYKRHYMDKNGNRVPMRAVCKSLSVEQPTTIYLPYSFRVYSGISTEYSKRTGLIVSARDCIKTMTCVQSRITLVGNNENLYGAICTSNVGNVTNNVTSAIDFPAGTDTLTITAAKTGA